MKVLKGIGYWLISLTWGCVMTAVGLIVALVLLITGHRPYRFHYAIYFRVGKYWGGLELGPFFLLDSTAGLSTKQHEHGHGIQNLYLGPLMPFLVCLPSAARYWLREQNDTKGMVKFSTILFAIAMVLAGGILGAGIGLGWLWMIIVGAVVAAYFIALYIWLVAFETPKYEKSWPDYDDMFWEGNASRVGAKYFKTNNVEKKKEKKTKEAAK